MNNENSIEKSNRNLPGQERMIRYNQNPKKKKKKIPIQNTSLIQNEDEIKKTKVKIETTYKSVP